MAQGAEQVNIPWKLRKIFRVYLLVPPPAPYVTLINEGEKEAICSVASFTLSKEVSVFGGNTSKDNDSAPFSRIFDTFILYIEFDVATTFTPVSQTFSIITSPILRPPSG